MLGLPRRLFPRICAAFVLLLAPLRAAPPFDLVPLNRASPNLARVFNGVRITDPVPQPEGFKAGEEILLAVYAYLSPNSPVTGNTAYRDRLLLLLDDRFALWTAGTNLDDISFAWQASYAYMLLKHHRPADLSTERRSVYEAAIVRSYQAIFSRNPLLYDQKLLAHLWLNGDIRQAMSAYFGAMAVGDAAAAERARVAIDDVMSMAGLADGGTRYVGFWGEVATYHEETVRCFIWWWRITGSTPIKAALDATRIYSLVANEPSGFTEQSSNIPYKHMYNNLHNRRACLWKAYLYDDGYNYFFGASEETPTSTELLNAILYQPNRRLLAPPSNFGVFFDGNIQGPRGRWDSWGWVVNGRDVQRGGPESLPMTQTQGYMGRQTGKATFVGAFALGPVANKTSLKGALDTINMEFKQGPGVDTEHQRGRLYRFLAQDERTAMITRRGFGTLSTNYRISTRTSANASVNWNSSASVWVGQQLWVLTSERMIGILQIVNDSQTTVHGLDARLVFSAGRAGIMGTYHDLVQVDDTTFTFADLRLKLHARNLNGTITQQRIPISDLNSTTDNFSVLMRVNDELVSNDQAFTVPAGTRRWIVVDLVRSGVNFASPVINVLAGNSTYAVLQFTEGARKVRIVQNLTDTNRSYTGNFVVGSTYASTSLHRSWNDTVTPLSVASGTAVVADTIPPFAHMIAVNSNQPDDHHSGSIRSEDLFGGVGDLVTYALGAPEAVRSRLQSGRLAVEFPRLRSDTTYFVEGSSDLSSWAPVSVNPGTIGQLVEVADTQSPAPSRFLRVRVARP